MERAASFLICGKKVRPVVSTASKPSATIPDLVKRNFDVIRPNKVWVTDITYVRTWEGWLYLAVVMDLFSRKIIGWAVASTLRRELVLDAVIKAVRARRIKQTVIHPIRDRSTEAMTGADSASEIVLSQHEQAR